MAGQSGANGKNNVFLETSPVTINDDDLDLWGANCLDISLGPRPGGSPQATVGPAANRGMDYSALSRMLATTIGTTMMHLNQVVAPQGGGARIIGQQNSPVHKQRLQPEPGCKAEGCMRHPQRTANTSNLVRHLGNQGKEL